VLKMHWSRNAQRTVHATWRVLCVWDTSLNLRVGEVKENWNFHTNEQLSYWNESLRCRWAWQWNGIGGAFTHGTHAVSMYVCPIPSPPPSCLFWTLTAHSVSGFVCVCRSKWSTCDSGSDQGNCCITQCRGVRERTRI
jgi:hypothetical protein